MDALKKEIKELSKEVLEIQNTRKEDNINIRVLESEINHLDDKIEQLQKEKENVPNLVKHFRHFSRVLEKAKKRKKIEAIIGGVGLIATVILFNFNLPVVVGITGILTIMDLASLGYEAYNINNIKVLIKTSVMKLGSLDEQYMDEGHITVLAHQRDICLNLEIKDKKQECNEKQQRLNQLKEERTIKENTYHKLKDRIKELTAERRNLTDTLLEEYESPVIDLKKPLYKGKRFK